MARPLRIIYQDAFYHVTARGNERRAIFISGRDYERFLTYVASALQKYRCILHAFVLMRNHYHLILQTPEANLSSFMHSLNTAYTTYFNIKRSRSGHLFQGRFKALLIDVDAYLLELSRYIHLNPVRAGVTQKPEDYPYSSYRSYMDPGEVSLVSRELTWSMMGSKPVDRVQSYRDFVESALGQSTATPFQKIYGGAILGRDTFIKKVLQGFSEEELNKKEISYKRVMASVAPGIEDIVNLIRAHFHRSREEVLGQSPYRAYGIYLARKYTVLTNAEIGRYFGGLTYSAVTKVGTRMKARMMAERQIREQMRNLEQKLSRVKG
jgi:putative transposase